MGSVRSCFDTLPVVLGDIIDPFADSHTSGFLRFLRDRGIGNRTPIHRGVLQCRAVENVDLILAHGEICVGAAGSLSGFLHHHDGTGEVDGYPTVAGVGGNGIFQALELRREKLQWLGEVHLQLVRVSLIGDDPVFRQEPAGFRGSKLIDGFNVLNDLVGIEEKLHDSGVRSRPELHCGDLSEHIVRNQHGVWLFFHVAVLDDPGYRFIEEFENFIGGDAGRVEPLIRYDLVELIGIEEAAKAGSRIPEIGNTLHRFFIDAAHSVSAALLQVCVGDFSRSSQLLDGVAKTGTVGFDLVGYFLTEHISAGEILCLIGNPPHRALLVVDPICVGVLAVRHFTVNGQNARVFDVGVLDFKRSSDNMLKFPREEETVVVEAFVGHSRSLSRG